MLQNLVDMLPPKMFAVKVFAKKNCHRKKVVAKIFAGKILLKKMSQNLEPVGDGGVVEGGAKIHQHQDCDLKQICI